MIISNTNIDTNSRKPKGRLAFWSICCFALAALCLSLLLLTGCEQIIGSATQPSAAEQEADNSGFVVEDTAIVNVEIDEQ